jgi:hypothetical protein
MIQRAMAFKTAAEYPTQKRLAEIAIDFRYIKT